MLSTTTKQSGDAFSFTSLAIAAISINCIVGLVGVSIHTIYNRQKINLSGSAAYSNISGLFFSSFFFFFCKI